LKCANKGIFEESFKAKSIDEARNKAKAKYPNCEILSVRILLND